MLTISTALDKVLTGQGRSEHVRVSVYDTTWRDLTSYPGFDAVDEVTWRGDIDSPFRTATVRLWRDVDALSLAPLMSGGAVSRRFNPATSPSALLSIGRRVRIEAAIVGADVSPASGDWTTVFEGYIDSIDSAAGNHVVLECRDYAAMLQDSFIEEEAAVALVYYSGAVKIARVWQPSTAYSSGEFIIPTDGRRTISGSPRFYECTTGGTSGTSEPAWPTSSTVADNSATHTYRGTCTTDGTNMSISNVLQGMLDWAMPWGGSATDPNGNALSTVGSPSWNLKPWLQDREPLYDAMRRLAEQLGWDLRYRYDSAEFVLTLYQPDRAAASPTRTFGASEYKAVNGLRVEGHGIRTVVQVAYSDASDLDPNGQPKRKVVKVTDSTSISTFGRKFMEIAESSASQIDSSTEATALANAALADLKDPKAALEVELTQGFPYVEVGDYYRFSANNRHFSSAQDLAVAAFQCTAAEGRIRTVLTMRGQPAGAYWSWHKKDSQVSRQRDRHSTVQLESAGGQEVVMNAIPGGVQLVVDGDQLKTSRPLEYEFHVDSSSSGFTPSSSTLVAVSKTGEFTTTDLIPGKTYYGKVVPRIWNASKLVRGQPFGDSSNKTYASAVAGKNSAVHLNSDVGWGRLPLNGGFETVLDSTDNRPDHWTETDGTWGNELNLMEDGNNITGRRWVKIDCVANEGVLLKSAWFEVTEGELYSLTYWYKIPTHTATSTMQVTVEATGYNQVDSWPTDVAAYTATTSGWTKATHVFRPCAGARYARVWFDRSATDSGTLIFQIDDVRVEKYECAAIYKSNSGQSIPDATSTIIDFEDQVYDPFINDYDAVNTSVVTTGAAWKAYARTAGRYLVTCQASIDWDAYSGAAYLELNAVVNGTREVCLARTHYARIADVEVITGSAELLLASGDYVQFYIFHSGTSGAKAMHNDDDFNRCSFRRVGDYGDGT